MWKESYCQEIRVINRIICPSSSEKNAVSLWSIAAKVRWEAIVWGVGTAIGELPPYFMARAGL